jgi:hypothetical protein
VHLGLKLARRPSRSPSAKRRASRSGCGAAQEAFRQDLVREAVKNAAAQALSSPDQHLLDTP